MNRDDLGGRGGFIDRITIITRVLITIVIVPTRCRRRGANSSSSTAPGRRLLWMVRHSLLALLLLLRYSRHLISLDRRASRRLPTSLTTTTSLLLHKR